MIFSQNRNQCEHEDRDNDDRPHQNLLKSSCISMAQTNNPTMINRYICASSKTEIINVEEPVTGSIADVTAEITVVRCDLVKQPRYFEP